MRQNEPPTKAHTGEECELDMFSNKINSFQVFICKNATFVFTRVIFELLWRDYFKFVGLKYGNRIFHMNGKSGFVLYVFKIF